MNAAQYADFKETVSELVERLSVVEIKAGRIDELDKRMNDLTTLITNTSDAVKKNGENFDLAMGKMDEILLVVKHSKNLAGFVKRHGPRLIAFGIGALATSGKLGPEMATLLRSLFGV
jgi:hypothetical protein